MTAELTSRNGVVQQPTTRHYHHPTKLDEIEILESAGGVVDGEQQQDAKVTTGWICCAPCIWLKTSATVHKLFITTGTLLVTALLVASPVLFLLSTAPSQIARDCQNEFDCHPSRQPPTECNETVCKMAAISIQTRMNWKIDPCTNFKDFACCSTQSNSLKAVKSAQETVDLQMQQLLTHNTTSGIFRKLGRLYGSCLRYTMNSSTIRLVLDDLGGYIPVGALGPSKIAPLISKIYKLAPSPLFDIYYDLSYGKKPQIMLVIDGPGSSPVLANPIRWKGPKVPSYLIQDDPSEMLTELLDYFLPIGLTQIQKQYEKTSIIEFITELNQLRRHNMKRDFLDTYLTYNLSTLGILYPYLNWTDLLPPKWTGAILIKSPNYFKNLEHLLVKHPSRIAHNSLILNFALEIIPSGPLNSKTCTKSTMWALPLISSALYLAQFPNDVIRDAIDRTYTIFDQLKAHLKRAPSLKGTALVKLSQLKIQITPWSVLSNMSRITEILDQIEITSDNWFENILKIYKIHSSVSATELEKQLPDGDQIPYAYPTVAKAFYDSLSHSIVVPISVILIPYFDIKLPSYLQYASVGVSIGKEIFRSVTKSFDTKLMNCVPDSVNVFSNSSRLDILIHSGGLQIAYHSMLSLTRPIKGMLRLPGMNLTPTQIFYIAFAQDFCAETQYSGFDVTTEDFNDIFDWLIAQGGTAADVFHCNLSSVLSSKKTCTVL